MKASLKSNGFFIFIIFIILFGCRKEFSFENQLAKGTLKDENGACLIPSVQGNFYTGRSASQTTNFIEIKVNVTAKGRYTIDTDIQNGFQFTDSGTFNSVGIHSIKLKPNGTPVRTQLVNFSVRFDTSICNITVNVIDSTSPGQGNLPPAQQENNWKFTDTKRGITYQGIFENNYIFKLGTLHVLVLSTRPGQLPGDSTLMINIGLPAGTISKGDYSTNDPPTGIVFKTFSDACVNCAGGGLIPRSSGAVVRFIITGYDQATKRVKGSFSGSTIDWFNEIAIIKDGEFSAIIK